MRPKRLISLLVAVCMMITMLPLSAVTAFAADTSTVHEANDDEGIYKYAYTVNNGNATITKFLGPVDSEGNVDSTNNGPYYIEIPSELGGCPVTGLGENSFAVDSYDRYPGNPLCRNIHSVTIPQSVTSIGMNAFRLCTGLTSLTIEGPIKSMGWNAFYMCTSLETLSLGENIETIGDYAFCLCSDLKNVTIPEQVKRIEYFTFFKCSSLESITLPAGLTSFQANLKDCPADCVIYYNNYKAKADALLADNDDNSYINDNDKLKNRNFLYLCKVTFDANGGKTDDPEVPVYKTEKIIGTKANKLKAIPNPTRAGYNFTGWYTADGKLENGKLFNVKDTAITDDITLYAHWELAPKAPVCHPLTVKDGVITSVTVPGKNGADPEDITEIVKKNANEDGSFNVPEGATVSVAFDKDAFADSGLKFGHWDITGLDDPNAYQDKESFAFEMPAKAVTLKAMTQDASIEDDEPDIVGPIVIGTTVVVGGAVLGYQAYSLGAEFAGKLMALPYFPSNRSALAMMLWEDAGKPMPESELLYPDVEQEEQDMDLQHAARWAMENELIPDLNDEGTAPEEMKFFPANPVSKLDVLNAWQKAQELKNN